MDRGWEQESSVGEETKISATVDESVADARDEVRTNGKLTAGLVLCNQAPSSDGGDTKVGYWQILSISWNIFNGCAV